jgi:integrase
VRGVHEEQQYLPEKKTPIPPDDLAAMVRAFEDDCKAKLLRDRAILLVGWATGFRRSELASLTAGDLEWTDDGVIVRLRRVNRYQQKEPDVCHIDFLEEEDLCPARALQAWLDAACITGGPLFVRIDRWGNLWSTGLSGRSLTRIVKKAAACAGFDPSSYSCQSLRSYSPSTE